VSDSKKPEEPVRYPAEELARELSDDARELAGLARAENDYNSAWKIARERVGMLLALSMVGQPDSSGAPTFEEIVRLAGEEDDKR
jgi:hypothetical protein